MFLFGRVNVRMRQQPCAAGTYYNFSNAPSAGTCRTCLSGGYCPAQSQLPVLCPGGTYNPTTGNSTVDACRGCPAGSYCPMGSSQFIPCGNASVYCPVNSSAPLVVDDGRYSVPSNGNASSQAVCEPGSYCIAGVKRPCAGGTWSNEVSARPDRSCGWAIPAVYRRCDVACGHVDGVS